VAAEKVYFGVSFQAPEQGVTEYLAGMKVAPGTSSPEGLAARTVSGGRYAVFECPVEAIGPTYQHVFQTWLPRAAVRFDEGRAPFERYPESAAQEPVSLYIPIR
jgi:AraC family transcriptional regulator